MSTTTLLFLFCVIFLCYCIHEISASEQHYVQQQHKKQQQHYVQQHYKKQQHYYNYYNKYANYQYRKKYHYKRKKYKYIKWPRIRGRCSHSPWFIKGVNPVIEEAKKGNVVVLFMLKANDPYSYNQLGTLSDLADHYKMIGRKVTVMALNHRSRRLPAVFRTRFKNIKFYEEPAETNIYAMLRADYRQIIVYDKCGRQQYQYSYPYSWMGYPWVKLAIDNARRFYEDYALCGRCKPYVPPTTGLPVTGNYTVAPTNSTTRGTKPTEVSVLDGPYTNIPN